MSKPVQPRWVLGFKRDQDRNTQTTKKKKQIDRCNHLINSSIERLPTRNGAFSLLPAAVGLRPGSVVGS
jgi:hypothetical protein